VVLLHGQLLSQTMQEALAQSLAERGQQVVTLDLLGHGQSDRPDDMALYSMGQYAQQVLALLDHLEVDKAVIGGTSLGANVALEFAALAPDRLQGLLIEMPVLEHGLVAAVMIFAPLIEIMVLAKPVVRAVSAAWRLIPRRRLPLFGRIVVEALAQDHSASASVLQGLVYGRAAPPARLRRTFEVPALVIGHPRDPLHPFSDADTLSRELPNATLLAAASILELRTRPDRLTPQIAAWLDAVWGGRRSATRSRVPARRLAQLLGLSANDRGPHVGDPATRDAVLLEVALVVLLGRPEHRRGSDLRHDRTLHAVLGGVARALGDLLLPGAVEEDGRAILIADVRSLAIELCGVVEAPELLEQSLV
jgi:pimeloyl-ACP methyl ester carboxylesterase